MFPPRLSVTLGFVCKAQTQSQWETDYCKKNKQKNNRAVGWWNHCGVSSLWFSQYFWLDVSSAWRWLCRNAAKGPCGLSWWWETPGESLWWATTRRPWSTRDWNTWPPRNWWGHRSWWNKTFISNVIFSTLKLWFKLKKKNPKQFKSLTLPPTGLTLAITVSMIISPNG